MNLDSAKRVVALKRQINSYGAMARKGELTEREAGLLIVGCEQEIAAIRGQEELSHGGAGGVPPVSASKGAKA